MWDFIEQIQQKRTIDKKPPDVGKWNCIRGCCYVRKKGKVHYSGEMKEQVRKEIGAGKSQCEVSRKYGISRYTIQSWCGLRPETKLRQIAPLPKGRPRKTQTLEDYQKENKRLKMENQLLRDFLSLIERM